MHVLSEKKLHLIQFESPTRIDREGKKQSETVIDFDKKPLTACAYNWRIGM